MTIIPLDIINCTVVKLLRQVVALVFDSYGEQHCITTPIFLSNGNNRIPQFEQMTIKEMLASNLNLSMLLSQREDTMISMYEIMHTPLSCYGNLLYVKERLVIYYSLLKRSLRFSMGNTTSSGFHPLHYM